jgi:lipoate-protein ligase A
MRLDPPADGPTNMALDEAMLLEGSLAARLYEWEGIWVSLGRFQRADLDVVEGVRWVRRPTGGRAVLHGHDWTVAIVFPLELLGVDGRLKAVYAAMARPLIAALRGCGVKAMLGEDSGSVNRGLKVADCFAHVAPNDIVDEEGNKVCGCALKLTQTHVLVQASVPKREPLVDPGDYIVGARRERLREWDHDRFPIVLQAEVDSFLRNRLTH